jgi:preprotein translocase subunit SecG
MTWVIGILTFILVLDCFFLILLILIQLPKKEAGLGQAFGGSTTDALFGAGSGTVLTKITKYSAGTFFAITFLLSILSAAQARQKAIDPRQTLKGEKEPELPVAAAPATPTSAAPAPTTGTPATTSAVPTLLISTTNVAPAATAPATNAPATPGTNATPSAK